MMWEDERYVRLYTRDTADWLSMSFEAQALWAMILRKADRAGIIDLGRRGRKALALVVGHPTRTDTVEAALNEILAVGCCELAADESQLVIPNFMEAQETVKSPAERMRDYRRRTRDAVRSKRTGKAGDQTQEAVTNVTRSDAALRAVTDVTRVTDSVTIGTGVTPCCAVPCCAVPTHVEQLPPTEQPAPVVEPPPESAPPQAAFRLEAVEPAAPDPAEQVFEHWRKRLDHPKAQFDAKRRRAVERQLDAGRSVAELCLAIDGCAQTPHNMGQNDTGQIYDDLELICRDDSHVDRFIRNAQAPPKPKAASAAGAVTKRLGKSYPRSA